MSEAKDASRKAIVLVAKAAAKKLGDKMAASKRPFWRKVVTFFRGKRDG